ncbi:MAG: 4Fe-4S dicluster domain-containing protein [Coriobacteriia bacterium]|nr:4Fe-4S dicluster domain-containing protein [Coriobacteriia bacterium]
MASTQDIQSAIRARAGKLLQKEVISCFIGWEAGRFEGQSSPLVVRSAADAQKLIYNDYCVQLLAKYLLTENCSEGKVGVAVRGCESRGINLALKDGQLQRENLHLVGIACQGVKDFSTKEELKKCQECTHRNPIIYDDLIGSEVTDGPRVEDTFAEVIELEALSHDERYEYWSAVFTRCIRCKACRDVCPGCTCNECFTDQAAMGWQGKQSSLAENANYGITRMFHSGERCIECGECERVCPARLPLMQINRKVLKDAYDIFGEYVVGIDDCTPNPLDTYLLEDVEEFM